MNLPLPFLVDKTGMCIALTKKDAIELVRELTWRKVLKKLKHGGVRWNDLEKVNEGKDQLEKDK